jgi:hypothetical protein
MSKIVGGRLTCSLHFLTFQYMITASVGPNNQIVHKSSILRQEAEASANATNSNVTETELHLHDVKRAVPLPSAQF